MGCSYSACQASPPFDCVRVIHITGDVEDLRTPVTVAQITGSPPKHVLCSAAHLAAFGSNPFRPHDQLQPGRVYFLLPHAVLRSESSAVDLATLMTRLAAAAAAKKRGTSAVPAAQPGRSRARAWKPELDSIEEGSMERETSMNGSSLSSW